MDSKKVVIFRKSKGQIVVQGDVKLTNEEGIDIVHGNDLRVNLTWSLPTRISGSIYIWHQRSFMSSSALWRISALLANHFVTISQYVHQSLPSNIPKSKKTLVLKRYFSRVFRVFHRSPVQNKNVDFVKNSVFPRENHDF